MNLNPLSSNYLNNFSFDRFKKPTSNHPKPQPEQSNTKKAKSNAQQKPLKQEKYAQKEQNLVVKSAEFQLKQKLNKSSLFYTKQGYMFCYKKRDDQIYKRAAIAFPDGTIANCYVLGGKLNGWSVLCKRNSFYNIFQYKNSRLQGNQFIYDIKCGLMLRSSYVDGRLKSVYKCCAQNQTKFEKFVNNKAVYSILKQTLNGQFFKDNFPYIQCSMGNFYGKKQGEIPNGLGILITPQQLFYGQFERGLLNGIGTISFQGGNYIVGQLQNGLAKGICQYSTNGRLIYKYNDVSISEDVFNEYFQIAGWEQNEEIKRIFYPIINFYNKLRKIEVQRVIQADNKDISVVDVQFVPEEEDQGTDRKDSSSSPQTQRLQIITTAPGAKNQTNIPHIQEKKENKEFVSTPQNKESIKKIELVQVKMDQQQHQDKTQKKKPGKLVKNDKKKQKNPKEKNVILSDNQWQQIIQQLQGEQSVGREDAFLQPAKQSLRESENGEISSKSKPSNSNQKRIGLVKIDQQDKGQITAKEQNNLNKMIQKSALKK